MITDIPKLVFANDENGDRIRESGKPGWIQPQDTSGNPVKPIIRCMCGELCGIGLHHVHTDGTVTASFLHGKEDFVHNGKKYSGDPKGCGWHVFLRLSGYNGPDFPPVD